MTNNIENNQQKDKINPLKDITKEKDKNFKKGNYKEQIKEIQKIDEEEEEISFEALKEAACLTIALSEESRKKVMIDKNSRKKSTLVNDYKGYKYLPKTDFSDKLYVHITKRLFKHRIDPQVSIPTISFEYKPIKTTNVTKENPFLKLCSKRQNKNLLLLNPIKGGFKVWYKGALGIIDTRTAFIPLIKRLNWNTLFINENDACLNPTVIDTDLTIRFPTVRNNFSKCKKRRLNLTEFKLLFLDKDYAEIGEED